MIKTMMLTVLMFFCVAITFAHPPKTLTIVYDEAENQLTIEAVHKVSNVENHYIDKITIYINDVEKEVIVLTKQSSPEMEKYIYEMDEVKKGDVIKVTTSCSRMGSKYAIIKVK